MYFFSNNRVIEYVPFGVMVFPLNDRIYFCHLFLMNLFLLQKINT